ncbi:hypothetical protein GOBAR_AA16421 [Gossypium barbadense]|uniref:DUF4283 domain-containing protein n=1 Tax=Gossypium barbadense TaxID=3634 RepID=A0A2P5XLL0_GOSBA|nr:hypothetical protein GOBAR_AA16421 [Gossypium barbadense]
MAVTSLCEGVGFDDSSVEGLITKKVRFKDKVEGSDRDSLVDQTTIPSVSWKDLLVGNSNPDSRRPVAPFGVDADEDLDMLEGDIKKLFVNGIFFFEFSERIQQILIKDMGTTVVLKLMGCNTRYSVLQNKINSLWKPALSFQLMDIESRYFLAKFQSKSDSDKVFFKGHWIIYGQYLTVQPWTMSFNLAQLFSSVVMVWIKLLGLLGPKGVITLSSKWGKDTLHGNNLLDKRPGQNFGLSVALEGENPSLLDQVVKAGRSHQAQLVDVEEIIGEELPSAVGDDLTVRAGVSLISNIQLRITHFNLTFEGPVEFVFPILEGGLDLVKYTSNGELVMGSSRDSFRSSGRGLREKLRVGQYGRK